MDIGDREEKYVNLYFIYEITVDIYMMISVRLFLSVHPSIHPFIGFSSYLTPLIVLFKGHARTHYV